jgi:hypothetical protein
MPRPIALLLAVLLAGSLSARPYRPVTRSSAPPDYRITDLRAQLFYSDRGSLSDNLLARPNLALWNTIIGEGDAGGRSTATLIVVEVTGQPDSYGGKRRVELAVSTERKEILRRQLSFGVVGNQGHAYVGFWLYETGCEPLRISTALLGQPDPSRRVATLPFHCGE